MPLPPPWLLGLAPPPLLLPLLLLPAAAAAAQVSSIISFCHFHACRSRGQGGHAGDAQELNAGAAAPESACAAVTQSPDSGHHVVWCALA
jgi:hypothetical protein